MSGDTAEFRQRLIDDYQGAVVRLATLRADGVHYLLFAWVELYPFDMNVPAEWTSGKKPWSVPGKQEWTCGFSATPVTVAEAVSWYEAAAAGVVDIGPGKNRLVRVQVVQLGPEPAYGRFCVGVDAPFVFTWHDGPRIHRYVPLSVNPGPVRQLAASAAAREWLSQHLGFDPYRFDEWLGGLALLAPDPLCSAISVFPSARAEDGGETLTILAVPRRSAARGVADVSGLSLHVAERRTDGWTAVSTVALDRGGYATIPHPQPYGQVAYAVVCPERGLLHLVEPSSWIEQIVVGMNVSNSAALVEVPAGGRRKPRTAVLVQRYFKGADISVGKALNDAVRARLIDLRDRRKDRERRAEAPQRVFGIALEKARARRDEILAKRKEAEDFVGGLVSGARKRVLFVDPYFGLRETRLFALRASNNGVVPRILTGLPGLRAKAESGGTSDRPLLVGDLLAADLPRLAQAQAIQAPEVRVMSGADNPVIHDRYLVVDHEVWHCGPSFNELGERLGVIARLPDPLSVRRSLSAVWGRSLPLVEFWEKYRASSDDPP